MSIRLILEALSGHDYRVTWQRWAVAAHIALQGDKLFTVEELYNSLKDHYPEIGLTTVYRTLDLLVELGIIDRIPGAEGTAKYCLRSMGVKSAQTLVCRGCGAVMEVDFDQLPALLRSFAQQKGFVLDRFEVTLFGECSDCSTGPEDEG